MDHLEIRAGVIADFPKLAQIISSSTAWICYGIDYRKAVQLFEQMPDKIYIAELNQNMAGFFTIRPDGVGNIGAYIRMLAVDSNFRSCGIGTQLIDYAGKIAAAHIPNLFLICSVENINARRFYERNGFEQVGLLKDLAVVNHDEILYRKRLAALY